MDEFEKNEMNNEDLSGKAESGAQTEQPGSTPNERNTEAPSGRTYSANTNQYVSWEDNGPQNGETRQQAGQQQNRQGAPRREYGTQYGYYNNQGKTPNYYSNNGTNPYNSNNYQWDFSRYESAENAQNASGKKKSSGKGFKVFLSLIAIILGGCIISLASFGIYSLVSKETPKNGEKPGTYENYVPSSQENSNIPEFNLEAKPEEENMVSANGKLSATEVYNMVNPSVVGVVRYQYEGSFAPAGSGSGIIISEDGYVLTNAHVINGASAVKVVLYNEEEYEATVVGMDVQTDIAVLKINANNLSPAKLGDSTQTQVGETVYALGNPGGLSLQSSLHRWHHQRT